MVHEVSSVLESVNLVLGIVAIVMSVVAIWYAVVQHRDAKRTLEYAEETHKQSRVALKKLDETAIMLGETALQLPTRYIGRFPANVEDINRLIPDARQEIVILKDFGGYSSYSAPKLYSAYERALEDAAREARALDIRLYVYDQQLREEVLRAQFDASNYSREVFKEPTDALLREYLERKRKVNSEIRDYESFISSLLKDEVTCLTGFQETPRINCFEVSIRAPIYLWMIDRRECIFSFENEPEKQAHFTFRTRDGRLIEYFTEYLNSFAKYAKPFVPRPHVRAGP